MTNTDHLKALGSSATKYAFDKPDTSLLETFGNPMAAVSGRGTIKIVAPEFTSLCPITGQPDFATIVVEYRPRDLCVESKSWKLYLGSFRNHGEFHESCIATITQALIDLLDPWELLVRGEFTPRGGIPFWPEIWYKRPEEGVTLNGN